MDLSENITQKELKEQQLLIITFQQKVNNLKFIAL